VNVINRTACLHRRLKKQTKVQAFDVRKVSPEKRPEEMEIGLDETTAFFQSMVDPIERKRRGEVPTPGRFVRTVSDPHKIKRLMVVAFPGLRPWGRQDGDPVFKSAKSAGLEDDPPVELLIGRQHHDFFHAATI
jgi:hypothetical protein